MAPKITTIIGQRAFEAIRNKIGNILAEELAQQFYLTSDDLFDCRVWVERFVKFDASELPCVNVSFSIGDYGNQHLGQSDGEFTFNIDCYAKAKTTTDSDGDSEAMYKSQKLLGVCQAILEDPQYKTLGFVAPFIKNRHVRQIIVAQPDSADAESVVMSRIVFIVKAPDTTTLLVAPVADGLDTVVKLAQTDKGYVFTGGSFPVSPTFCDKVKNCLGISEEGDENKFLNEQGNWVEISGGTVVSVFGRTGIVTAQNGDYTKAQVGLGNVDNTSDADKPISTATQTALNAKQDNLGYVPENVANKTDVMSGNTTSSVNYLSAKGVYDWVIGLGYQVALTAANFGSFINGLTGKTTPVDADSISIVDSADSNNAKKLSWANLKATLKTYFDTLYQSVSNIYHYKLYKWSGSVAITGTTSETQFTGVSAFIPANTLNVGDRLVCESLVLHPSGSAGVGRFRLGTSSAPSPVTDSSLIGIFSNIGTATYIAMSKTFIYVNSSTEIYYLSSTPFAGDVISSNATVYSTASFDSTVDNYIIPTIKPNNTPDTYTLISFTVAKI